jgi:8-oxo-dGTP pyrophosphatase MutT (NUDIX family)
MVMKTDEQLKWKLLSSEYLFKETWLRARRDTCEKPDGRIVENYYVMEYPEWVTALPITENNEVILVKQYRHAIKQVDFEIPGGCVDASDKSYEEAIRRELLEETGYAFDQAEYLGDTSPNSSTNANWMHMFLLTGGKKVQQQQLDANEEIEVMLVPLNEFIKLLLSNKLVQAMHVTTIFFALYKLGKISFNV